MNKQSEIVIDITYRLAILLECIIQLWGDRIWREILWKSRSSMSEYHKHIVMIMLGFKLVFSLVVDTFIMYLRDWICHGHMLSSMLKKNMRSKEYMMVHFGVQTEGESVKIIYSILFCEIFEWVLSVWLGEFSLRDTFESVLNKMMLKIEKMLTLFVKSWKIWKMGSVRKIQAPHRVRSWQSQWERVMWMWSPVERKTDMSQMGPTEWVKRGRIWGKGENQNFPNFQNFLFFCFFAAKSIINSYPSLIQTTRG